MKTSIRKLTRGQFMKLSSFAAITAITGCSHNTTAIEGKPLHHTTSGFRNYPLAPEPQNPGFSFIFRRFRAFFDKPDIPEGHVLVENEAIAELNKHQEAPSITWIGHSTYLLRIEQKTILFDPFFCNIASPLPIGPERYVSPGIPFHSLPPIDALVVSHNHYDHLDADAIEKLKGTMSEEEIQKKYSLYRSDINLGL